MLRIAIIALLIALVAGALGMGGLSNFAVGVSQFFFSVWGLLVLAAILVAVIAFTTLRKRI